MWVEESTYKLPKTKRIFQITSVKGELFFVKPGTAFNYSKKNNVFNKIKMLLPLKDRVDRVAISPCGRSSLHLLKEYPLLAYHENKGDPTIVAFPVPKTIHGRKKDDGLAAIDAVAPDAQELSMTYEPVFLQNNPISQFFSKFAYSTFGSHVTGVSICEDGHVIALAIDSQFWVWHQYPENVLGVGIWTDLTANQKFMVTTHSNHPETINLNMKYHGFHRNKQTFTLHPVLAPNVPQNYAVSFQDIATFDNPDEGIGVCCLTAVLPPCRPYNELQLYISICYLSKGSEPVFDREKLFLPTILEGFGGPCIWWSVDCRFAVIAVSQSLVIVTRYLNIIEILPLEDIFPGEEPLVSSVAWSCSGEFFLITSIQGSISGVSRDGQSLRHMLCALEPFTNTMIPILVAADSKDPGLFIIYSEKKFRPLRIDTRKIPRNLQTYMSLQFPQKTANDYYDKTVAAIKENGVSDPISLVRLLFYTDLFRIFPYMSPLRYLLFTMFEEGARKSFDCGNYNFTYFIIRCIFRITDKDVDTYRLMMERLSYSTDKKHRLLYQILDNEVNQRDYILSHQHLNKRITVYDCFIDDENEEDKNVLIKKIKPYNGRDVELLPLIQFVKDVIYNNDAHELKSINCDLNPFLNILIELGQFENAMKVSNHRTIILEPAQIFAKIVDIHKDDAAALYRALISCIAASPDDENELRSVCLKAIIEILKERIGNSIPKKGQFISPLVPLEEDLELFVPESLDHFNDFAIIFEIALCTADFPACKNFFDRKPNETHQYLRDSVRTLFSLLWFIRWRYLAIVETARIGHGNDATLRLLSFPDFVKTETALQQIEAAPKEVFSKEVYALYMGNGTRMFEDDPAFPEFAAEMSVKIDPRTLSRVSKATLQFGSEEENEVPHSKLLVSAIVSHIVPWLRCGIARALAGFKCREEVPQELLDFEELDLPSAPPPKREIETKPEVDLAPDNLDIELSPIKPKKKKRRPKPRNEITIELSESDLSFTKPKKKKKSKPKKPLTIDDISAAPPIYPQPPPQNIPPYPYYPPPPPPPTIPMYYPYPEVPEEPEPDDQPFLPIWDFNPNDFKIEEEEEDVGEVSKPSKKGPKRPASPTPSPPKHDVSMSTSDIPKLTTVSTQAEQPPQPRPLVILRSQQKPKDLGDTFDFSMSSSLSDIQISEPIKRTIPVVNPFPLDDGLHKKVEMLLDEVRGIPDAPELPEAPKFVPPPIYDLPKPTFKDLEDVHIPQPPPPKNVTNIQTEKVTQIVINRPPSPPVFEPDFRPPLQNRTEQPNRFNDAWRPPLTSVKQPGILGIQEIPPDQFGLVNQQQRPRVKLAEIYPP